MLSHLCIPGVNTDSSVLNCFDLHFYIEISNITVLSRCQSDCPMQESPCSLYGDEQLLRLSSVFIHSEGHTPSPSPTFLKSQDHKS